ncbi:hypothetical protein FA10DRAFT_256956 [Acaromyces ingoldii]|uniref:Amino acid transporter transmembrane domain-containing protein n=1 Tax=Acaromyces ingoldii TaxID=215250 RepID=A0A316YA91_9BASI|nr:hypothetical protein FA10DRAFT_256956 [Acaromyces ingoldii]PWN86587.1 hypothetical protein FA10DRAFT_256956 [Acaromyces ingoldii]
MTLVGRFRRSMPAAEPTAESSGDETSQASGGMVANGSETEREKGAANLDKAEKGDAASVDVVAAEQQTGGEITYRTMSWQKCAALLFGEYVCLAIMSFPWAFKTLGMAGGILSTLGLGLFALYTSLTLHKYCMLHPHMLNIADFGYQLFGKHWLAYELTAAALVLNNTFIQGLHTLTGSEILNVLSNHGTCTLVFSIVIMIACFLLTLPRKMENVAIMGIVSAISMGIALLTLLIFTGIQGKNPVIEGFDEPVRITAWAPEGTTFVDGFNAFLNIVFTWVGQICYPTFIAEMKEPADFPKALYAVTVMEFTLFTLVGIVVYYYFGQYTEAPAVATLKPVFKKISFAFVLPTTIIIGVIYAAVVAKYLFHRFTFGTKHYNNHTVIGWATWTACCLGTWVFGWVIGEAVPFFSVLLSLMSALFDGWFGFIFWAAAYRELYKGQLWVRQSILRKAETIFNIFIFFCGLFVFGPGTYTSVEAIIQSYATGSVKTPFTCANNAV